MGKSLIITKKTKIKDNILDDIRSLYDINEFINSEDSIYDKRMTDNQGIILNEKGEIEEVICIVPQLDTRSGYISQQLIPILYYFILENLRGHNLDLIGKTSIKVYDYNESITDAMELNILCANILGIEVYNKNNKVKIDEYLTENKNISLVKLNKLISETSKASDSSTEKNEIFELIDRTLVFKKTRLTPNGKNGGLTNQPYYFCIKAYPALILALKEDYKINFDELLEDIYENNKTLNLFLKYALKINYRKILLDDFDLFNIKVNDNQEKLKKPFQKIVYGAPGTGKSYSLNQEAKNIFKRDILLEKTSDGASTKKYWVVTCGEGNWAFEEFKRQGIYSIGWEEVKNISKLTYDQLEKEVVDKYNNKFGATHLNNIAHEMKVGDILLVRKGVKNKEIVGYGVISQEQYEEEIRDSTGKKLSDFYHNIKVDWHPFSPIKLEGYSKYFQRIATYKANPELIKEFEKVCPQETPSKFDTKEVSTIERVTFYDGYTYGQFVGMYKPITLYNGDISYEYVPGPFMKQLVLAYKNSKDKFCLLIEEINRAKADKVFGNIFQLLDRNSHGESEYPISVSKEQYKYLKENLEEEEVLERIENEGLYIPNNLYIWATMNSADDGVQHLDTAFKRRWKFNYINLNANEDKFGNGETFIIGQYKDKDILWNNFRTTLNDTLKVNITEDRLIAPFFISPNDFEEIDTSIKKIDKNILSEKVLMYIFDDLLRHYPKLRKEIFHNDIKTFSDIHEKVTKNENFLELIFNEGFLNQILGSDGTDGKE